MLIGMVVLGVVLSSWFGVHYLPRPSWVQMSSIHAIGAGIAVFAALVFFVETRACPPFA